MVPYQRPTSTIRSRCGEGKLKSRPRQSSVVAKGQKSEQAQTNNHTISGRENLLVYRPVFEFCFYERYPCEQVASEQKSRGSVRTENTTGHGNSGLFVKICVRARFESRKKSHKSKQRQNPERFWEDFREILCTGILLWTENFRQQSVSFHESSVCLDEILQHLSGNVSKTFKREW